MASGSTWERIERQKLRLRGRMRHRHGLATGPIPPARPEPTCCRRSSTSSS